MKKLLLASLLAFGSMMPMAAAEFSVLFQDKPIENGSVIEFYEYTVDVQEFGEYGTFYTWTVDPELYFVADEVVPVMIRAESLTGVVFKLCAGGTCMQGVLNEKPVEDYQANVPLNLMLDWSDNSINDPEFKIPAMEIAIEVYLTDDPNNKLAFTLKMGGFEASAGVESIGADAGSVVLNGKTLQYDLAGPSQISVYSLSGKTVLNKAISGSGSISLDGFSKGVYLYRVSGKSNKAAKFIIK